MENTQPDSTSSASLSKLKTSGAKNTDSLEDMSNQSKEVVMYALDYQPSVTCQTPETPTTFNVSSTISYLNEIQTTSGEARGPTFLIKRPALNIKPVILTQKQLPKISSIVNQINCPPTLFLLALTKLNGCNMTFSVLNTIKQTSATEDITAIETLEPEPSLCTPSSLTSAPPSYSFVLRQAASRRPRLLGTFLPSPSFVQHTPPPNYATAFNIHVDNTIPPTPRILNFGFTSMLAMCHECGYAGPTIVLSKITLCTHLCALILCLFCCWICAPLPYVLRSCKNVYHYCRNCRALLGMYSPTNPETVTYQSSC